jgi:predicted dithiol-disulfide oxidoreductase (DUF899 family)
MTIEFPGESAEYRAVRNRLLEQEIELRRAMEAVAAARRGLPPGGVVPQDYVFQTQGPDGEQQPVLNVFHRDGETIRHFWGSELFYAPADPGQEPRHVGTIEPLWNLFDLTPEGRGTGWDEQVSY